MKIKKGRKVSRMGKKDLWQSDYFNDKGRFADMLNGSLFEGEQVVRKEELEEVDSSLVHHEESGNSVNVIRDKVYKWKGKYVSICILENQSYVDYRMVFRVMLEEAVNYVNQQKEAYKKCKASGYKFRSDEFLSRMRKEEKYIPVITLVLYLGKEKKWDGAKSLYEMLEIDEKLKPFVTNHKLNLYDYHNYDEFSKFQTENRFLFELLSNAKDEIRTEKIIKTYLDSENLDKEALKAILGMLDVKVDIEKYKRKTGKGVKYNMCKAWDDHMERGRQEGLQEGRQEGLQEGRQEGLLEGRQEGIRKGLDVFICTLKKYLPDMESVYAAVVENELYKDISREQVREYYYGNRCTRDF